mmetsp:Transcript_31563/g.102856  ORF Transcript_31563/g.102856 Transcript_31563/m.102856 type:complete len:229 (-) Transcript_31563:250-936(-)
MPIVSSPSPWVYGRRPIATSTTSASMVSASPPFDGSTVSVTPVSEATALVTLLLSLNFIPCFWSERWNCFRTSASIGGTMLGRNSTTVISAPRRPHTDAISRPMMPPPTTTIFFGTSESASAPVEETMRFSSISSPGSGVTSEPVARMTFLVFNTSSPPSLSATVTSPLPVSLPAPFTYLTLFFLNKPSIPCVRPPTALSLAAIIFSRSRESPSTMIPWCAKSFLAIA